VSQSRERAQEQTEAPPTAERSEAPVATPVARILAMQRGSGNAATARWLSREGGTATTPASGITELDELLDHVNVDEDAVIALITRMSPTDKATVVSGGYRDKLADCLDTGEMVRVLTALPMPLATKLDWARAAAGGASSIDYGEIASLITAAPQPERDALKTTPWREFFTDVCDNDTIVTAVTDLHFDLGMKLRWVIDEGTNAEHLGTIIRNSPTAELAPVKADAPMMAWMAGELSSAELRVVREGLDGLLGTTGVTNTTDTGNEYEAVIALWRNGMVVNKHVNFISEGTFAAGGFDALKARLIAAVTSWLSLKYKVRITSLGAAQPGDGDYPITVSCTDDSSADYPMHLWGGTHGRSGVDEDEGNIYELGQENETSLPDIVLAHESAHMMLGASDEYANASVPGRVITNDHSLMGDFYAQGIASAEIKARHFQFLVTQVSAWFPGRTVTIVR
jgi:hypothetical protein